MNLPRRLLKILAVSLGALGVSGAFAELPVWRIDYEKSQVRFVAEQAGAEFQGSWGEWDAEVFFDPENLAESHAVARFHVSSVQTLDAERDATLQDPEWFHGEKHAFATFETISFSKAEDGRFEAAAELQVKGLRTPLTFHFQIARESGLLRLDGEAEIDRLAAEIGTGEWTDTAWIGQWVRIEVMLYANTEEAVP